MTLSRSCSVFAVVAIAACAAKEQPAASPETPPPPGGVAAQMVNATILTNGCRDLGMPAARQAERAMDQLIEGCTTVPGGKAQFEATLQPGGRIEIDGVPGQPDVVPICILKHSLMHKVPLTKPCHLDVKIEQTSVSVVLDGGAG
jgi:hypothetical protein